jgi:hypothetical protein
MGRRLPGLAALLLAALPAAAHDFWIAPADFTPLAGEPFGVELRVGDGFPGEAVPRRDGHDLRFALIGEAGEMSVAGVDGASPAGVAVAPRSGDAVLVYRGADSALTLPAEIFEAYLREEGLEDVAALRAARGEAAGPGRELYSRSVKALVTVGPPGAAVSAPSPHLRPTGLPLELVPETRPAELAPGDELVLRLLRDGEPLAGARVRAVPHDDPAAASAARTGSDGRVSFDLDCPGTWLFAAVAMEEAPEEAPADWRSTWTSLTLDVTSALNGSP